jgi:hypothetical protein
VRPRNHRIRGLQIHCKEAQLFDHSAMYWARHFSSCRDICSHRLRASALVLSDCLSLSWFCYYWFHAGVGLEFPLDFNSFAIACFFGHLTSIDALLKNGPHIDQNTVGCGMFGRREWASWVVCFNTKNSQILRSCMGKFP